MNFDTIFETPYIELLPVNRTVENLILCVENLHFKLKNGAVWIVFKIIKKVNNK